MKLTLRRLRSLIRESLVEQDLDERAMTSADAGDDLALYVKQLHDRVDVALYRVVNMRKDFDEGYSPKTMQRNIVAMISASENGFDIPYFEVTIVAAEKGWGPFLYDVAMKLAGGLMPDRMSVSNAAHHVWERYDSRNDVKKEPLKKYHVRLHGDRVLDQGYSMTGPGPDTANLIEKHDDDLSSNVWDAARRYATVRMS